jgi:hypothetical protein
MSFSVADFDLIQVRAFVRHRFLQAVAIYSATSKFSAKGH